MALVFHPISERPNPEDVSSVSLGHSRITTQGKRGKNIGRVLSYKLLKGGQQSPSQNPTLQDLSQASLKGEHGEGHGEAGLSHRLGDQVSQDILVCLHSNLLYDLEDLISCQEIQHTCLGLRWAAHSFHDHIFAAFPGDCNDVETCANFLTNPPQSVDPAGLHMRVINHNNSWLLISKGVRDGAFVVTDQKEGFPALEHLVMKKEGLS